MTIAAARRRADRNEDSIGIANRRRFDCELEPALFDVARDQVGKARLEDRHLAAIERCDAGSILVDAGHMVAEIGKARPRDEPDIAGTDHCYAHTNPRSDRIGSG